jgi:hypothetical protein
MHGSPSWKETIMLRISKREEQSRTTLIVDGRLSEDYVELVEMCCSEAISTWTIVQFFLRHVSAVDGAGRALPSRLVAKGVRLRASGVYTSHLVRELTSTPEGSQYFDSGACDTDVSERRATDGPRDD